MKTFEQFTAAVAEILDGKAKSKGYNTSGKDGPNPVYEIIRDLVAPGDGHALGEIVAKVVRYAAKGQDEDILKVAAWAFLVYKYRGSGGVPDANQPGVGGETGVYGMEVVERRKGRDFNMSELPWYTSVAIIQDDILKEIQRVNLTKATVEHRPEHHFRILMEEAGEVGEALVDRISGRDGHPVGDSTKLLKELVQVAATATIMAANVKRGM